MSSLPSHYIVNAKGPDHIIHTSEGLATVIDLAWLTTNRQRPNDVYVGCFEREGQKLGRPDHCSTLTMLLHCCAGTCSCRLLL